MNDKILQLLVQSGLLINVSEYRVSELDPNIKKFAELIVKECADRIDDLVTCDGDGNQILDCDDVRTELIEHFGVK